MNTYTRSAPKSRGIPLDEARLRPHLRQVQPPAFTPGHLDTLPTPALSPTDNKTIFVPSPGELRGIPIQGRGVRGEINDPELRRQLSQLDDWEGRSVA